jgi:hypothetical protein
MSDYIKHLNCTVMHCIEYIQLLEASSHDKIDK